MTGAKTPTGEIVSYGVDWITGTAPRDGRDIALLAMAGSLFDSAAKENDDATVWRMQGYDGRSVTGLRYGVRKDGVIVQMSGEVAHDHWQSVARLANHVTRIDLEVTVRLDPKDDEMGNRAYRAIERWRTGRERAPACKAVVGTGRVETVYVGSRASATFGRLYDKEAEGGSRDWAGCWRYEVEAKGDVAGGLARLLAHHEHAGRAILVYVFDWFASRGCRPLFAPPEGNLRVVRPRAESTDGRKLRWLTDQVAPVIAGLISRGLRLDVLMALGLEAPARRRGFQLPAGDL